MVVALLVSLFIGLITTSLVLADTLRRNLPARTQAGWIGFVGLVSIGGSIAVTAGDDALYRWALAGDTRVAVTPRQLITTTIGAGLALSALVVLTYGVGSRYGPLSPTEG